MSQSPLVTDHVPTTKKNPRNQPIAKLTWHHMAGKSTANACAHSHADHPTREASANYYIGLQGDMCSSVEENYRAWTSGSGWNDQRAITFEISNDEVGGNWHISDKALEAAIALSIDCCKRNGITKVWYDGTKDAPLTLHKMFQATACPGPYIVQLMQSGYIAQRINSGLSGQAPGNSTNPTSTTSNSTTDKNPYSVPTGLTKYGSKGNGVGWIQWQLCKIFGYTILIDSVFGATTDSAVKDFQKQNKLDVDGIVGPLTIAKLKNENSTGANGIKKIDLVKNGIDYTNVFNAQYYADAWPDLKAAFGYDAQKLFNHFLTHGMKEQRQACRDFNVQKYAARYDDLRKAFGALNGNTASKYYKHFCEFGRAENRIAI